MLYINDGHYDKDRKNINNFNTIEEIKNYDITQGYSEKFVF